ncbi:ABC transporter permease [Pseudonocardia alaniniphila]|uniref:ABC transporter permease n=1 Tax=Pseudonocardia alaniniphila TaxID=75291 RepID=A0ABS9T8L0_9PSEU|nr:ABC transporter permease [Pseudonocardia alaniniphila]MCH6164631.1 ABC transporter permease [Pseudonocardia alaniniphila]
MTESLSLSREGRAGRVPGDEDARRPSDAGSALLEQDRREAIRFRRAVLIGRVAVAVVVLGAWQLASGRLVSEFFVSSPSDIVVRLVQLVATGELWPHLTQTLVEVGAGLLIGVPLGIALGVALGTSQLLSGWLLPYVMALYSLPRVALAPLFIVWFGIGLLSKITMVVTMVIFVIFYNVYQGVRDIEQDLLDVARSFRASRLQTLRWIVLPSLTPWLVTALRLSIGIALIGAVIAELIAASSGLGYYIKLSSNLLDVTGVFAGLAVITAVAIVLDQVLGHVERRVVRHH